mmetsp:Transcript_2379/g.5645  ORF Transcript_2379/g.5645 Transcript_2379/m.5645 type:complete len:205 (-) Transcript_2379:1350-1964(-)
MRSMDTCLIQRQSWLAQVESFRSAAMRAKARPSCQPSSSFIRSKWPSAPSDRGATTVVVAVAAEVAVVGTFSIVAVKVGVDADVDVALVAATGAAAAAAAADAGVCVFTCIVMLSRVGCVKSCGMCSWWCSVSAMLGLAFEASPVPIPIIFVPITSTAAFDAVATLVGAPKPRLALQAARLGSGYKGEGGEGGGSETDAGRPHC